MYKVIKIYKGTATNFIELLNLDTGTIDKVLDDSSVVSYDNFGFIKEGGIYDCKIELFDDFLNKSDSSVEISLLETNIVVGNTRYLKALINSDVYFIPESEARDIVLKKKMNYKLTRKDLIQVDDVIHADCL